MLLLILAIGVASADEDPDWFDLAEGLLALRADHPAPLLVAPADPALASGLESLRDDVPGLGLELVTVPELAPLQPPRCGIRIGWDGAWVLDGVGACPGTYTSQDWRRWGHARFGAPGFVAGGVAMGAVAGSVSAAAVTGIGCEDQRHGCWMGMATVTAGVVGGVFGGAVGWALPRLGARSTAAPRFE